MTVGTRFKLRRDTAANWTSVNPVLLAGEPGFETDTKNLKIGDGTTAWTSLGYTQSATYAPATVVNLTGTADSAAILAAFNKMKVGGKATGTLLLAGHGALDTALDLDGGYSDVENASNWATAGNEQFRLVVNGSLTPAAGIGNAISVHGFNGCVLDLNFRGGGQLSDNALDVYNLLQATITITAMNYAGTVLHGDTYVGSVNTASRRIRCSRIAKVYANTCGQAIYWRGFESFGDIGDVWDDNCTNGSYFGFIADTQFNHYETFNPASQTVGLTFEGCNNINGGSLALGDRASDCLLKIIGNTADPAGVTFSSDFGSLFRVRASCQQPAGVTTYNAVKLVDVHSIDITDLWTFRSLVGLSAVGSNFRVKRHYSQTADTVALSVNGDAYNAAPICDVKAHYRFTANGPILLGSALTGGVVKVSGHIESTVNNSATASQYAIGSTAGSGVALDVSGLTVETNAHLTGMTNHAGAVRGGANAYYATNLYAPPTSAAPAGYVDPTAIGSSYLEWTIDPAACGQGTVTIATGKPLSNLLVVKKPITVTNLSFILATAGSGTTWTSGQNFITLKDSSGTIIASTADIATALASIAAVSEVKAALTAPQSISAGLYYVEVLLVWSAGTTPTLMGAKASSAAQLNAGQPSSTPRAAYDGIVRTAPVSKAPSALTLNPQLTFCAMS